MTNGPTTINGPLQSDAATVDAREMVAYFSDAPAAQAARQALINAGIDADQIVITDRLASSEQAKAVTEPADAGVLSRLREAILPEDGQTATRAAIRANDSVLTLKPSRAQVETAIGVLKAAAPSHFDADLELWRNAG